MRGSTQINRSGGFTIVELMVVVTIIAVLVAMLIPAISEAKRITLRVTCAARMRQLGVATIAYSQDFAGMFPSTGSWSGVASGRNSAGATYLPQADGVAAMAAFVDNYISDDVRMLACPASWGRSNFTTGMCNSYESYFASTARSYRTGNRFNTTGWLNAGNPSGGGKTFGYFKWAGSFEMYWEPSWNPSDNPRYGIPAGNFRSFGYMTQKQIDRATSTVRVDRLSGFDYSAVSNTIKRAVLPSDIAMWSDRNSQNYPGGWAFIAHSNNYTPAVIFNNYNTYYDFLEGMNEVMMDGSCTWYGKEYVYVRSAPQGAPIALVQTWGRR